MHEQERHRLTPRERRVVLLVALFMAILFIVWITTMVLLLPNPGHGSI
ncbi:MAG: hypothetical protein IRY97_09125 [Thermomicrobiaceae bacterium]|nr:hypothetical protein [Thermomicrobiaceae bacterium]